jgi:S1-C subfamily serine protease
MRKRALGIAAFVATAVLAASALGGAAFAQGAGGTGSARGWLGIYTQNVGEELREALDLEGEGALVSRVIQGSPAERAGVQRRDYIVRFNDRPVEGAEDLTRLMREARPGQTVPVVLIRDGVRRTLNVRLGERPAEGGSESEKGDEGAKKDELKWFSDDDHEIVIPDFDGESFHLLDPRKEALKVFIQRMSPRGRLGVRIEDLNPGLAEFLGIRDGKGVMVVEVLKDTPAEKAGLKAGDVIVSVGDRNVEDAESLVRTLRDSEGAAKVAVVRKGQRLSLDAKLEPKAEAMGLRVPRALRIEGSSRVERDELQKELQEELRKMREELRELRQKLEELER